MKSFICCALVLLAGAASAQAGDCCESCGCDASCCKVCRCVPSTKKVTKIEYDCECEDFCVPGPSHFAPCATTSAARRKSSTRRPAPRCARARSWSRKRRPRPCPRRNGWSRTCVPSARAKRRRSRRPRTAMADGRAVPPDYKALAAGRRRRHVGRKCKWQQLCLADQERPGARAACPPAAKNSRPAARSGEAWPLNFGPATPVAWRTCRPWLRKQ